MTSSTSITKEKSAVSKSLKEAHFALCSYCFWSASILNGKSTEICPSCKSHTIDSIPLSRKSMLIDNYSTMRTEYRGFSHRGFHLAG